MDTAVVTFEMHYQDVVETKFGTKTKHTFVTDDGTRYESWKAPIAARIAASMSEPLTILFDKKVSGQYTNLEIKDVLGDALPSMSVSDNAEEPVSTRTVNVNSPEAGKAKEERITRLAIWKTAFEAFTALAVADGGPDSAYNPILNPGLVEDFVNEQFQFLLTGTSTSKAEA